MGNRARRLLRDRRGISTVEWVVLMVGFLTGAVTILPPYRDATEGTGSTMTSLILGFGSGGSASDQGWSPALGAGLVGGGALDGLSGGSGSGSGATPAEAPASPGFLADFWGGLTRGDFYERSSWAATAGQVLGGVIPYYGQLADIRDTVAAIDAFGDAPGWRTGADVGLAIVGYVPGLGDFARGVGRAAMRSGDEALDAVATTARRSGDDVASAVYPSIRTNREPAVQSLSPAALEARAAVEQGAIVYRTGTMGTTRTGEAQFWSFEHPSTPGYAERYGIPPQTLANIDFVETAVLRPGTDFVTREAPGFGSNAGGAIELVVPPGGVRLRTHATVRDP